MASNLFVQSDGLHIGDVLPNGGIKHFAVCEHFGGQVNDNGIMSRLVLQHVLAIAGEIAGWAPIAVGV
jgi:hypothetical protein